MDNSIIKTFIVMGGLVLCVWFGSQALKDNKSGTPGAAPQAALQPPKPQYDQNAMIAVWNTCMAAEEAMNVEQNNLQDKFRIIQNVSLQGASPAFKQGYLSYCEALNDLICYIEKEVPKGIIEGVGMGALNLILRGETDGGANRIKDALNQKVNQERSAHQRWKITMEE